MRPFDRFLTGLMVVAILIMLPVVVLSSTRSAPAAADPPAAFQQAPPQIIYIQPQQAQSAPAQALSQPAAPMVQPKVQIQSSVGSTTQQSVQAAPQIQGQVQNLSSGVFAGGAGGGGAGAGAACPTDDSMQNALNFKSMNVKPVFNSENVPWEGCSWVWQAVNLANITLTLPDDTWEATTSGTDGSVKVWYGPVTVNNVTGFTLRYRPFYVTSDNNWVNNPCQLLQRENDFGQRRNPSYQTTSGNVTCGGGTSVPTTGGVITDPNQIASMAGGDASKWSRPDATNFPKTWKYRDKGHNVQLRNPGNGATIDYWNGGVVTSTTAENLPVQVDEATLKLP